MDKLDKAFAKIAICDYYWREFGEVTSPSDLSDHGEIPLAYTTLTDYEIPIQVSLNIDTLEMVTYIDGEVKETIPVDTEDVLIMDFDSLICDWQTWIEDNMDSLINE